jgi:AI-2 transport protein TqsA
LRSRPGQRSLIIIGVVPFLMFVLLVQKNRLKQKLAIVWGDGIAVSAMAASVTRMVLGFVLGNLAIGSLMALITLAMLFAMHVPGAPVLGTVSGFLNLVPFLGAILATVVPLGAALLQNEPVSALAIIVVTVISLHVISANLLVPRMIRKRVSVRPVAATVGILFWEWLWGLIGVLLAVQLTAFAKILADSHPSLSKIANLLAEPPIAVPPWSGKQIDEVDTANEYREQKSGRTYIASRR